MILKDGHWSLTVYCYTRGSTVPQYYRYTCQFTSLVLGVVFGASISNVSASPSLTMLTVRLLTTVGVEFCVGGAGMGVATGRTGDLGVYHFMIRGFPWNTDVLTA